jgi:steroid delta-isomerase-like uncharacterized protein
MTRGEEILRTWFQEIWNNGRIELFSSLASRNIVFHAIGPNSENLSGLEGFRLQFDSFRGAFSNINFTVNDTVASESTAAIRWTCTMTHTGDVMGMNATGKSVRVTGMAFIRIKDGKAVEAWDEWDRQGLIQQLGGPLRLA